MAISALIGDDDDSNDLPILLRPALLWTGPGFVADQEVVVAGDRVREIRPATGPSDWAVALLPGFGL